MQSINRKIVGYAVRAHSTEGTAAQPSAFVDDADRRLRLEKCPTPAVASLRWQRRPDLPAGNPGQCYMVSSPEGTFAMFVGHIEADGVRTPFEVWVNGEEAPRGLTDLARSLSIDMRCEDRAWLRRKLEALSKTDGQPFDLMLPDGKVVVARSAVDAFAKLVLFRCEELGAFSEEQLRDTPVLNAMMSRREPRTNGMGSVGWFCDIENHSTGDEFLVTLKEAVLEDGQKRPFSVWFSGSYPSSLDGLAKSLSLDMRLDPSWIARKLRQLVDVQERRGDFFAPIPGNAEGKQKSYPSTVAYVAALIQYRFMVLGLLDEDGFPVTDTGVVRLSDIRNARAAEKVVGAGGADCGSCGSKGTVVRLDSCSTCVACSSSVCG